MQAMDLAKHVRFALPALGLVLLCTGCERPNWRKPPEPVGEHVATPASDTSKLSESQYLMRKATVGSRAERLEALDVIERAGNKDEMLPFLLKRLEKEDDRFLRIRIMHVLASLQDVRAVDPLRDIARWDNTRVGMEAVKCLYELGDDNFVPKLIRIMRNRDEFRELSGLAWRSLKSIYQVDLPANSRVWNNYYRSHRLTPYQRMRWYEALLPPKPPVVEGTHQVVPHPRGAPQLPQEETRVRRRLLTFYEFWKPDEP